MTFARQADVQHTNTNSCALSRLYCEGREIIVEIVHNSYTINLFMCTFAGHILKLIDVICVVLFHFVERINAAI